MHHHLLVLDRPLPTGTATPPGGLGMGGPPPLSAFPSDMGAGGFGLGGGMGPPGSLGGPSQAPNVAAVCRLLVWHLVASNSHWPAVSFALGMKAQCASGTYSERICSDCWG